MLCRRRRFKQGVQEQEVEQRMQVQEQGVTVVFRFWWLRQEQKVKHGGTLVGTGYGSKDKQGVQEQGLITECEGDVGEKGGAAAGGVEAGGDK